MLSKGKAAKARQWAVAVTLWLGLGFSLGWYYTITYYGAVGWPMPVPEALGSIILYYFSVLNVATEIQGVHWMLVFPAAGVLWVWAQRWLGSRFGSAKPAWARACQAYALCSLPLIFPSPWLAWLGGQSDGGFAWGRMFAVALRRGNIGVPDWLTPLYFVLGLAALALQFAVHRKIFALRGKQAWLHLFVSAILFFTVCCIAGAAAAVPLRLLLE